MVLFKLICIINVCVYVVAVRGSEFLPELLESHTECAGAGGWRRQREGAVSKTESNSIVVLRNNNTNGVCEMCIQDAAIPHLSQGQQVQAQHDCMRAGTSRLSSSG